VPACWASARAIPKARGRPKVGWDRAEVSCETGRIKRSGKCPAARELERTVVQERVLAEKPVGFKVRRGVKSE
jgi:hypothetical protein